MSKRKKRNTKTPENIDQAKPALCGSPTSRTGTLEAERAVSEPYQDRLFETESRVLDDAREINEYMAALLGRHGVDGAEPAPSRRHEELSTSHVAEPPTTATKPTVNEVQARLAPMTEQDLQPRAKPPESAKLKAMRDVANLHAKSVLDTHFERCLIRRMLNSAAAGIACLIAAVVALACVPILGNSMQVGLMVAVVASVHFFFVCFRSTRKYLELVNENETNDEHIADHNDSIGSMGQQKTEESCCLNETLVTCAQFQVSTKCAD